MIRINCTGTCRVYRHENYDKDGNKRISFSTQLGQRRADGNWDNAWVNIRFKNGTEPNADCEIILKNAWQKFEPNEKNYIKNIHIFVNEYELMGMPEKMPEQATKKESSGFDIEGFLQAEADIPF